MSDLRVKAAAFYLVHLPNDNKTHLEQLEILENASLSGDGDNMAAYVKGLTVWEYFDHETVDGLLERIDDLEKEFQKVWNEALMLGYKNGSGEETIKI